MKKRILKLLNCLLYTVILFLACNLYAVTRILAISRPPWMPSPILPGLLLLLLYLWIHIFPVFFPLRPETGRLKACCDGSGLLILFLSSTACSISFFLCGCFDLLPIGTPAAEPGLWVVNSLLAILLEALIFWNGIIRVYASSLQLGIRIRVIGIACGMIPIAHLIALGIIIRTVTREVSFENEKILLNESRREEQICATRYPILMVHGVFFRDFRYFNYWGRIPKELETNDARIFYGNHQSAASVSDSGREIGNRILQIIRETGCEKVNIIAHSKGGLDARAALQLPGIAEHVASLTTVSTPHRGCEFADYLLTRIPAKQQAAVAKAYNAALKKVGDPNPDFLGAVGDLTASACLEFNKRTPDIPSVYYQSVGSRLSRAVGGRFPLNFTYALAKHFDGANDGLVGYRSFPWGSEYRLLTVKGTRGISHGDMIDLNRENLPEFDVREFYVQLVADLRARGF
ncbi:MAG: triacylglycerol lipase [Blautia sp.]|nr:triacylglycerol lipase [Blautia sp.]